MAFLQKIKAFSINLDCCLNQGKSINPRFRPHRSIVLNVYT